MVRASARALSPEIGARDVRTLAGACVHVECVLSPGEHADRFSDEAAPTAVAQRPRRERRSLERAATPAVDVHDLRWRCSVQYDDHACGLRGHCDETHLPALA